MKTAHFTVQVREGGKAKALTYTQELMVLRIK
jgi:hypothetical protein